MPKHHLWRAFYNLPNRVCMFEPTANVLLCVSQLVMSKRGMAQFSFQRAILLSYINGGLRPSMGFWNSTFWGVAVFVSICWTWIEVPEYKYLIFRLNESNIWFKESGGYPNNYKNRHSHLISTFPVFVVNFFLSECFYNQERNLIITNRIPILACVVHVHFQYLFYLLTSSRDFIGNYHCSSFPCYCVFILHVGGFRSSWAGEHIFPF